MRKLFENKEKGVALTTLIIIIVLIVLLGGVGITFLVINNKGKSNTNNIANSGNKSTEKSNNSNNVFFSEDYSIIYDLNSIPDSFWNEKEPLFSAMTNREYFNNKYTGQVGSLNTGDHISMPLTPNFTMYSEFKDGGGATQICDYFVTVDFNQEHIFYPNMVAGSLIHSAIDSSFEFYILDNEMNFNQVSVSFQHKMKTTKMQNENNDKIKLIYEDNNWAFFSSQSDTKTTLYADYYINLDEYDYINFVIRFNNIIKSKDIINEFVNKFMNNIKIKMINDSSTQQIIQSIRPTAYVELNKNDEKMNLGNNMTLNLTNKRVRFWGNKYIQWYDDNWDNGKSYTILSESSNSISNYSELNYEVKSLEYNNIKINAIYMTEDNSQASYRKAYGYSYFTNFTFEVGDSIYTVNCSKNFKDDQEIASYIQYIFDNVIVTNQ